jgi:hypothetical protein
MPNYRGIDQSDLVRSIDGMLALLETHSTGPECQKRIDGLREPDAAGRTPLGTIAAAADDVALAEAVRSSGVTWVLSSCRPLLEYHALTNTDGKGLAAVAAIHAWDGAGAAIGGSYTKLDAEMDFWLTQHYALRVDAGAQDIRKIFNIASHFASQDETNARVAFTATVAAVKISDLARAGAPEADLRSLLAEMNPHERYVTQRALAVLNVPEDRAGLNFERAFSRYCIEIPALTADQVKWTDPSISALREKVEEALMPYYETDEVSSTGIGGLHPWDKTSPRPMGVVIDVTARAAQAVADAGFRVLDAEGNLLAAQNSPKAGPKSPGFKP